MVNTVDLKSMSYRFESDSEYIMVKIRSTRIESKKKDIVIKISSFHKINIDNIINKKLLRSQLFFAFRDKLVIFNLSKTFNLITVLKSPHVNKKARRQFGKINYTKIIKRTLNKNDFITYKDFLITLLSNDIGCFCKVNFKY